MKILFLQAPSVKNIFVSQMAAGSSARIVSFVGFSLGIVMFCQQTVAFASKRGHATTTPGCFGAVSTVSGTSLEHMTILAVEDRILMRQMLGKFPQSVYRDLHIPEAGRGTQVRDLSQSVRPRSARMDEHWHIADALAGVSVATCRENNP